MLDILSIAEPGTVTGTSTWTYRYFMAFKFTFLLYVEDNQAKYHFEVTEKNIGTVCSIWKVLSVCVWSSVTGPEWLIPDPGKSSGSMRIRTHPYVLLL